MALKTGDFARCAFARRIKNKAKTTLAELKDNSLKGLIDRNHCFSVLKSSYSLYFHLLSTKECVSYFTKKNVSPEDKIKLILHT